MINTQALLAKLTGAGIPLATLTHGELHDGLPLSPNTALLVDKPTRDRIVILDPSCAPLLRRALLAEDVQPWHCIESLRYLVAIPNGWTRVTFGVGLGENAAWKRFTERHPSLSKHLAPLADMLRKQPHGAFWWELPPYPCDLFKQQVVIWRTQHGHRISAPSLGGLFLVGEVHFTTEPSEFLLGVLGSRALTYLAGLWENQDTIPIPQATPEQQEAVGILAEQLVGVAQARETLHQQVSGRIIRDLTPLGSTLGPVLGAWWQLDFPAFLAELGRRFKSDVPLRYREEWEKWLAARQLEYEGHTASLARLEAELNERVYRLYGLEMDEIAVIENALDQSSV
jgi:hypothetical protein